MKNIFDVKLIIVFVFISISQYFLIRPSLLNIVISFFISSISIALHIKWFKKRGE